MDSILTALGMAWGNFLSIPCPIRRWDNKQKNLMLAFLPIIGLMVGILWFLLAIIFNALKFPAILSAILMTAYIFGISGFNHIRGFGNCADSVISRGQKRRGTGTSVFSMVSMVILAILMILFQWALMRKSISAVSLLPLIAIPIITRAEAGDSMLKFSRRLAAETSVNGGSSKDGGKFVLISSLIAAVILVVIMLFFMSAKSIYGIRPFVFTVIVTLVVTALTAAFGKNSQREMNGDAASFAICLGELVGILAMVISIVR